MYLELSRSLSRLTAYRRLTIHSHRAQMPVEALSRFRSNFNNTWLEPDWFIVQDTWREWRVAP
jgi:hypothetical protein